MRGSMHELFNTLADKYTNKKCHVHNAWYALHNMATLFNNHASLQIVVILVPTGVPLLLT